MSSESNGDFAKRIESLIDKDAPGVIVVNSQDYHRLHGNPMWRGMHTAVYHVHSWTLEDQLTSFMVKGVEKALTQ